MMSRISLRSALIFGFAVLSGAFLFYTSQSVQRAEDDLRAVQAHLENEKAGIRVLKAEWAFLNSPSRLEALAIEYLDLAPPKTTQIMSVEASLPDIVLPEVASEGFQDVSLVPPLVEDSNKPASDIFIKPSKKPIRKAPAAKESFDALLNKLESSGGAP